VIIAPDPTQLNSTQSSNSENFRTRRLTENSTVELSRVGRYDQALRGDEGYGYCRMLCEKAGHHSFLIVLQL